MRRGHPVDAGGRIVENAGALRGDWGATERRDGPAARARGRCAGRRRLGVEMAENDTGRVSLRRVRLALRERSVFRDLSCEVPAGRVTTILGGSGSGKTTLLRLVAGLQRPDAGEVCVAERSIVGLSRRELREVRDRIGMLFQNGALLDSMTVYENLALPLRERTRLREAEIAREVGHCLDAVGLPDTESLYPRELSGGMVRRVALARAVVRRPDLLLCDEPYSGLDPPSRRRIEDVLLQLNRRLGATLLIASHDVRIALRTSDRIVFLAEGTAISGTPEEIERHRDRRIRAYLEADRVSAPPRAAEGRA